MNAADDLPDARAAGRICALAGQAERELQPWLSAHARWFDGDHVTPVTLAYAFAYPWLPPRELAACLRFELWMFRADERIDTEADSADEVRHLVETWTRVAGGRPPNDGDNIGIALSELRVELAGSPLWSQLGERWEWLFRRTFAGMLTEWTDGAALAAGTGRPTFEEYVGNSDSCGFRLIRLSDWITSADPAAVEQFAPLMEANWDGQISSRLANDLRTHHREKNTTDLNAVKLGVAKDQIVDRINRATARMDESLRPLVTARVRPAVAMERILRFGNGFYDIADFRPSTSDQPGATS